MRYFTCLILLVAAGTAHACVNIEGVTQEGTYEMVSGQSPVDLLRSRMKSKPASKLATLFGGPEDHYELELKLVTRPEEQEVDAVRDILTGHYTEAIEKLTALEAESPGRYNTAANLGTAYELAGDNQQALHWITESISRNEDSHYGTEWLHKKILESKIAMEGDPEYLKNNPILPIDEEKIADQAIMLTYDGREIARDDLLKALHYQLGERMLFVKPKDPVVADLLYSFALFEAHTRVLEPAVELLALARVYGYHDLPALEARMLQYQEIIDSTWKISPETLIPSAISLLVLCALLYPIIRFAWSLRRQLKRVHEQGSTSAQAED